MSKDPYQILKVHPSAKLEEIKKAYRKLVKIHHPDKGGDSAVMLEVNSAWEILKKKHKDLNLNQVNNSKLYNQNEYKRETNNHSKPEDLKKWFKQKWVRFGPKGKIRGDCARGSSSEGKPKCLPLAKARALGKKGRAKAARRKRREDPKKNRRGKAKNVRTK